MAQQFAQHNLPPTGATGPGSLTMTHTKCQSLFGARRLDLESHKVCSEALSTVSGIFFPKGKQKQNHDIFSLIMDWNKTKM